MPGWTEAVTAEEMMIPWETPSKTRSSRRFTASSTRHTKYTIIFPRGRLPARDQGFRRRLPRHYITGGTRTSTASQTCAPSTLLLEAGPAVATRGLHPREPVTDLATEALGQSHLLPLLLCLGAGWADPGRKYRGGRKRRTRVERRVTTNRAYEAVYRAIASEWSLFPPPPSEGTTTVATVAVAASIVAGAWCDGGFGRPWREVSMESFEPW